MLENVWGEIVQALVWMRLSQIWAAWSNWRSQVHGRRVDGAASTGSSQVVSCGASQTELGAAHACTGLE
jgi:hypothetical protein